MNMNNNYNNYNKHFNKRLHTAANTKKVNMGIKDCKSVGGLTVADIVSTAKKSGVVLYNSRIREEQQQQRIVIKSEATWQKYHNLRAHKITLEHFQTHSRDLGNTIYDLPSRWTGFISSDAIKYNERVEEHFYPRLWAGGVIMRYFLHHPTPCVDHVIEFFNVFRQVHYTTAKENNRLRPYQTSAAYVSWEQSYRLAEISPLIHEKDCGDINQLPTPLADYVNEDQYPCMVG